MEISKIQQMIQELIDYLEKIPLSKVTIRIYRYNFLEIEYFCEDNGIEDFTQEKMDQYMQYLEQRRAKGLINLRTYLGKRKQAIILAEYTDLKIVNMKKRRYNKRILCDNFNRLFEHFLQDQSKTLATDTVKATGWLIKRFLFFLEDENCFNMQVFTRELLHKFIVEQFPDNHNTMESYRCQLKRFFRFVKSEGVVIESIDLLLTHPVVIQRKVFPCLESLEIEKLFEVIDVSTALGKRDMAIMKLALFTGLRSCDIMRLKLSDIDWRKNVIQLIQSKTQKAVELPLLAEAGNAIADYILKARPKSNNSYVFLSLYHPYEELTKSYGRTVIMRYWKKTEMKREAGDGKSFHALRRTVGTNMLIADVPLTTISQVLGHNDSESAKRYLSLNDNMLIECCMDLTMLKVQKEGLI